MRRVRESVGRRGAALLFYAFLDFVYCLGLLFPSRSARNSDGFRFLTEVLPLWAWAGTWGLVGVVCLWYAFRRRDRIGYAAAIGLKVLWGLAFLGGWMWAGVERGWVTAAVFLALALQVMLISGWPEPPRDKVGAWTHPSS